MLAREEAQLWVRNTKVTKKRLMEVEELLFVLVFRAGEVGQRYRRCSDSGVAVLRVAYVRGLRIERSKNVKQKEWHWRIGASNNLPRFVSNATSMQYNAGGPRHLLSNARPQS